MTAIRSTATEALIAKLEARDIPTCARLISRIEDRDPDLVALLTTLYLRTMRPRAIGITGPPGIGKSTIINSLIEKLRCRGGTVAVLAIDPSSARSGGAVLGDRLRLSRHQDDQDVYIRSMATRGNMGGLAVAVADVLIVLAAMRWDVIILESVGVGQNEVDIGMYADTVVVLQSAHGGDEIQMTKAGLLEIADIFVVNKCDDPNTARMTSALRDMVHRAHAADVFTEWLPPVIETQANIDSGIDSLMAAIDARASFIAAHPEVPLKRERAQVVARIEAAIVSGFRTISRNMDWEMQSLTEDIVARRTDPYSLAGSIAKRILGTIIRE